MVEASTDGHAGGNGGTDRALRVVVPASSAEIVGAILMDLLGPFEQEESVGDGVDQAVTLVFYPSPGVAVSPADLLAALPPRLREGDADLFRVEARDVSRDWVEGWRDHFRPIAVGAVRIRPPWEPALPDSVDVVINPGLGFGTGLHPTTRGALMLLQAGAAEAPSPSGGRSSGRPLVRLARGPLVDAGTGSGVLAIAAAKLGWAPVLAFDDDPAALVSARENIEANGVQDIAEVHEIDVAGAVLGWFEGATVLANMTLEPVSVLLRRLGGDRVVPAPVAGLAPTVHSCATLVPAALPAGAARPARLVVSGVLAGAQERELLRTALESGFIPRRRIYEDEWVSLELLPAPAGPAGAIDPVASGEDLSTEAGGD